MVKQEFNFKKYVPEAAADYCQDLWQLYNFRLRIAADRKTKLGDFRVERSTGQVTISVNGSANPFSFLITYIHELAHLLTWRQHKGAVAPHGLQWKKNFQLLMEPLLNTENFPAEVLKVLLPYMNNPKASTSASPALWVALQAYNTNVENAVLLDQVPQGATFKFGEKLYLKMEKRRTRALCQNLENGRRYLISTAAHVERVA